MKTYYNQKDIVLELHETTECSCYDITKVLNGLSDLVKDKFGNKENYVEIKLFPGLKISSQYMNTNDDSIKKNIIKAKFSDSFRKDIKKIYYSNE